MLSLYVSRGRNAFRNRRLSVIEGDEEQGKRTQPNPVIEKGVRSMYG